MKGRPSFESLHASMRERLFALALQMIGDPGEAEDAVQATFVRVYRGMSGFRGEAAVETWVYRIALRESALRAKQRRARARQMGEGDVAATAGPEDREEGRRVLEAMQQLSADDRAVLSLLVLRDLSARQAAEVLGIPEGTVWSRAHWARGRLRKLLEERAV